MTTSKGVRLSWSARIERVRAQDDKGFALILSVLLILVVAGLMLSMGAVILRQAKPTQEARKQVQTVNAAAAGLQVSLTNLRAAYDPTTGLGLITKLPCTSASGATFNQGSGPTTTSGATFNGAVSNGAGDPEYTVSVAYYTSDPTGKPISWLTANALSCPLANVPYYAYLQSYGAGAQIVGNSATQGNRSQTATYQFATSNLNVVGGRMIEFGTTLCLDAGAGPWTAGVTTMTMQTCQALGTPRQTWQYRNDLSIMFGGDTTLNLCIQASASVPTPKLQACTGSGTGNTYPYAPGQQIQEWGFNDNGHFSAALDNGTVTNGTGGKCLQPSGGSDSTPASAGAALVWVACDGGTTGYTAWDPDPEVGAGKAGGNITGLPGSPTNQYVNYAEFGRCLDITGQNVDADHLIAYPCKQAPDSNALTWNQVWAYTAATGGYGTLSVNHPNGNKYCLEAPASGTLIVSKVCDNSKPDRQLWQATGKIDGNYPDSYRLKSKLRLGMCMSVTRTGAITFGSSNIIVETCSESLKQKWNAPPINPDTGLNNIQETVGG
jgi:Tfp pilus assembly protein PilX